MMQVELKHTLVVNKDAWFIRFYRWVWEANVDNLTFCKLFWAYVFSVPAVVALTLSRTPYRCIVSLNENNKARKRRRRELEDVQLIKEQCGDCNGNGWIYKSCHSKFLFNNKETWLEYRDIYQIDPMIVCPNCQGTGKKPEYAKGAPIKFKGSKPIQSQSKSFDIDSIKPSDPFMPKVLNTIETSAAKTTMAINQAHYRITLGGRIRPIYFSSKFLSLIYHSKSLRKGIVGFIKTLILPFRILGFALDRVVNSKAFRWGSLITGALAGAAALSAAGYWIIFFTVLWWTVTMWILMALALVAVTGAIFGFFYFFGEDFLNLLDKLIPEGKPHVEKKKKEYPRLTTFARKVDKKAEKIGRGIDKGVTTVVPIIAITFAFPFINLAKGIILFGRVMLIGLIAIKSNTCPKIEVK